MRTLLLSTLLWCPAAQSAPNAAAPLASPALRQAVLAIPQTLPPSWTLAVGRFLTQPQADAAGLNTALAALAQAETPGAAGVPALPPSAAAASAPLAAADATAAQPLFEQFLSKAASEESDPVDSGGRLETLDMVLSQRLAVEQLAAVKAAAHEAREALSQPQQRALAARMKGIAAALGQPTWQDGPEGQEVQAWRGARARETAESRLRPAARGAPARYKGADGVVRALSPEEFQRRFGVRYETSLRVPRDTPESFLTQHRRMQYPVDPDWEATLGPGIAAGRTADVYIAKVSEEVGHGVFAASDIWPGQLIGEYTGAVRSFTSIDKAYELENRYTMGYPTKPYEYFIDARFEGNVTRFINHASAAANAETVRVFEGGIYHVALVATRYIPKGSQIYFDYGQGYWKSRGQTPIEP